MLYKKMLGLLIIHYIYMSNFFNTEVVRTEPPSTY